MLSVVQKSVVNNTSLSKEENIVFRPIKHRFLKPHLVQQRYNIDIAVVKYFGNYFSGERYFSSGVDLL